MGSVMTCKLNPCCGDRRNCTPPERYDAPAPGPADAVSEAEVKAFRDTYREFFPGGGWPDKPTIIALLEAAQRARK